MCGLECVLHKHRTGEESQEVGHSRVEMGQSHPALLCSGSDISKIWIFMCVDEVNQKQLLVKCMTLCRVCVWTYHLALYDETQRRFAACKSFFFFTIYTTSY